MAVDLKKIALSGFVLVSFVAYSLHIRNPDDAPKTVAPKTAANTASSAATTQSTPTARTASGYKDGKYVGSVADAFYGNIQVQVTIRSGKIAAVDFLQYPNDRPESISINQQAMPFLQQEAIKAQSAHVDGVSGATDTSQAFMESLSAALNKAM
jgi:uncharacterized protein with FMN-binding domain